MTRQLTALSSGSSFWDRPSLASMRRLSPTPNLRRPSPLRGPRPGPMPNPRTPLPLTRPTSPARPQLLRQSPRGPVSWTRSRSPTAQKPVQAGAIVLKHKLKKGETLRTRTIHVANTITRVQGTEDISEARSVSEKVWEVKAVEPNGHMTFEYRLESVDMSQKSGEKPEVKYNSQTDEKAPEIFASLSEKVGKPLAMITIDGTGTVVDRENQIDGKLFNMGGMGELAVPLPADPVAIGAQWSIPRETRVKLENGTYKTIKLREQYTLEKVAAGVATISVDTHPLTPSNDPSVDSQLMQQLSKGTIKFDVDQGRLISKQLDWDDEVVGFQGSESSLKYSARFTEEPM